MRKSTILLILFVVMLGVFAGTSSADIDVVAIPQHIPGGDLEPIPRDPARVPEPASMLLLGAGLMGLMGIRKR